MVHDGATPESRTDVGFEQTTRRRTLLGAFGTLAVGGVLPRMVSRRLAQGYVLRQGDRCVPVTPLTGDDPVRAFYDYRKAETQYSSAGTTHLQRADGSVLFLYRGPNGLSLVAVHGKLGGDGDGGSVSFAIDGLPSSGEWVVRDDDYPGGTNYDNWDVDGGTHRIHWTWAGARTDGGAFLGLGTDFSVTVSPAFNEAAALYGEYYDGRVDTWEFLVGDPSNPERVALRLDRPVTVETGTCQARTSTPTTTRRPTSTRTTSRQSTTTEDEDDREEKDDEPDEPEDDEREERQEGDDPHEKQAEQFEDKAERFEDKAERFEEKADEFEEKAEEHGGEAGEQFEEKAERAQKKADRARGKADRARGKADRARGKGKGNPGRGRANGKGRDTERDEDEDDEREDREEEDDDEDEDDD